ncbi:unnamed protein product [Mytilus coruscus]|uniref:RNase H type-1 domain-containing protein n=1 Tax=Mytilus coruscus TaxID=42192 RepID=A0A6J8CC70_MYTCO|nr:unnamed protein product [Mytilus coruscus]
MNSAISFGIKSKSGITLNGDLKDEITPWRFLYEWEGKLEWKRERHLSVTIFTDVSTLKWGGVFEINDIKHTVGDSWVADMLSLPIMILEAFALLNVLKSFRDKIKGFRIDANVDNNVLIYAWNNEGSRSSQLNSVIKDFFKFTIDSDIILNLYYIPSKQNLADALSRSLTKCDATITKAIWQIIQEHFGRNSGHTLDLMALESNSMKDKKGNILKHFTPF